MRSFVMNHLCDCEVTSPKRFRDEIQKMVFNAYKKLNYQKYKME